MKDRGMDHPKCGPASESEDGFKHRAHILGMLYNSTTRIHRKVWPLPRSDLSESL